MEGWGMWEMVVGELRYKKVNEKGGGERINIWVFIMNWIKYFILNL